MSEQPETPGQKWVADVAARYVAEELPPPAQDEDDSEED